MNRRRRIAWVWSISYTFASVCVALAIWAYLNSFYEQAHLISTPNRFSLEPDSVIITSVRWLPRPVLAREIFALGGRALILSLVIAFPGFEMNQQVWAALRARPRRFGRARVSIYGWKLLALNVAILLAAPFLASLQFFIEHS